MIIDELKIRSVLNDESNGIDRFLDDKARIYCGVDPTSDSLHVGHLIQIITLIRLKNAGIKDIYFLIGGATGMIGDPSFKSDERIFLESDVIDNNVNCISDQVVSLFNKHNCAINIVNNANWYLNMNTIEFLREGKYLTVNYMSSKESVKKRIVDGISFTEFSYQLLQAYDFYYLNNTYNVNIQLGGADQWGNITSGIDFIKKKTGKQVFGFTTKLLVKSNGVKFGKTEGGCIWLNKNKTSPYEFFQFWINIPDDDIVNVVKIFSLRDIETIEYLISKHNECPKNKILQKELAKEMTSFIHGDIEMRKCLEISDILFGSKCFECFRDIKNVSENLRCINNVSISRNELNNCSSYYDFLCITCLNRVFCSKSEISRAISNNGVFINKKKVQSCSDKFDKDILSYDFVLVQNGKKNYFVIFLK